MFKRIDPCMLLALFSIVAAPVSGSYEFTYWNLSAGVVDFESMPSQQRVAFFTEVSSPFINSHSAAFEGIEGLTSSASYSLEWDEAGGNFDFAFEHAAPGANRRSSSSARIRMRNDVPLMLNVHGTYAYDLRAGDWRSRLSFGVSDQEDHENVPFRDAPFYHTVFGPPFNGTLSLEGRDILIPPGENWLIAYSASIEAFTGSSARGTGSGTLHFDLTVVPEPASACLAILGIAALLARRRTGKRRG